MGKIKLSKSVNHHIANSAIMIKRVLFKKLSDNNLNITPEQWNILYYLVESNGITISELSKITHKDFANMSRISQKLELARLISKKRDDADKRIFKLFITEKSEKLNNQLHQQASEATDVTLNGLDNKTRKMMVKNLKKIITNSEDYLK